MIRKLQYLKAKRGFSMVELLVVMGILAVFLGTVLAGNNNRREKINDANDAAKDFYVALQTEITNFQMFDGPLTMTLDKQYSDPSLLTAIGPNDEYGGMMYYPAVGGNYPFAGGFTGEHRLGKPVDAVFYVEFYVYAGMLRRVNYANDLTTLFEIVGSDADEEAKELCLIFAQEMPDRMKYRDGYYYARVSYTAPIDDGTGLTVYDYRTIGVKVDWTAYCTKEVKITPDPGGDDTVHFKQQNMLRSGTICGVHTTSAFSTLGTTGTAFTSY